VGRLFRRVRFGPGFRQRLRPAESLPRARRCSRPRSRRGRQAPLANTPWNPAAAHADDAAAAAYRERWLALHLDDLGLDPAELAIRFAAFSPGVSTAIVGSRRLEHLAQMQALVAKGSLPAGIRMEIEARFAALGHDWPGMI